MRTVPLLAFASFLFVNAGSQQGDSLVRIGPTFYAVATPCDSVPLVGAAIRRMLEPKAVRLSIGKLGGDLLFVWGRVQDTSWDYRLLRRQPNAISWAQVKGENRGDSLFVGAASLLLEMPSPNRYPLEVWVSLRGHSVFYRWTSSTVPNVPVAENIPIMKGKKIEDRVYTDLEGRTIHLAERNGKPLVVNFWAILCSPCVAEIGDLNNLVDRHATRGVDFLAVTGDAPEELEKFFQKRPFRYRQAVIDDTTAVAFFGGVMPRNIVINPDGVVIYDLLGGGARSIDTCLDSLLVSLKR